MYSRSRLALFEAAQLEHPALLIRGDPIYVVAQLRKLRLLMVFATAVLRIVSTFKLLNESLLSLGWLFMNEIMNPVLVP